MVQFSATLLIVVSGAADVSLETRTKEKRR